jgi:catechol 2,3-dioxygenase-like lactoylglutathione lyase family enzyme
MALSDTQLVAFLATRDADRARSFYAGTLGLRLVADTQHALVLDAAGTLLRIQKVDALSPHPFTALGWKVLDIALEMTEMKTKGIRFERYEFLNQDEAGVWISPDGTKVAWFKDPDGNTLSLSENTYAPSP